MEQITDPIQEIVPVLLNVCFALFSTNYQLLVT